MNLLLLLPLLAQQPQVQATIDKSAAEVGDDVVVTVKVVVEGGIPTEASVPPFTGLDLTGTSQSSVFTTINGRASDSMLAEERDTLDKINRRRAQPRDAMRRKNW